MLKYQARLFINPAIMPDFDDNHAFIGKLFDGEPIVLHEKPINPKDHKTYEEYLEALRIKEPEFS